MVSVGTCYKHSSEWYRSHAICCVEGTVVRIQETTDFYCGTVKVRRDEDDVLVRYSVGKDNMKNLKQRYSSGEYKILVLAILSIIETDKVSE